MGFSENEIAVFFKFYVSDYCVVSSGNSLVNKIRSNLINTQ